MASEVIEQIQRLSKMGNVESVTALKPNCYKVIYSPQLSQSPYSHLTFHLRLTIPDKYPQVPPFLTFSDYIYHLNIDSTTGLVHMPILADDWSPYLTLSAIFESLDNILEEPDLNYAASQNLLHQYQNQPERYAHKIQQMGQNVQLQEKKIQNFNQSQVENVVDVLETEEINHQNLQIYQNILPNNDLVKNETEHFKRSILISQINYKSDTQSPKYIKEKKEPEVIVLDPVFVMKESLQTESYEYMTKNLRKTNELIGIFMEEAESLEGRLKITEQVRLKTMIQQKLSRQWMMLEELFSISTQLKEKLMEQLKKQTRGLKKK